MTFLERFAGRPTDNPASLQLLLGATPPLAAESMTAFLRGYHPELAAATVELHRAGDVPGHEALLSPEGPAAIMLGLIAWGSHVINLALFAAPMPVMAVDACLQVAILPDEVKADARNHAAHILLWYSGSDANPLEQLVALAAVAGVLAEFGAIVTLNEEARTALLSTDLLPDEPGEDMLAVLRSMPIPYFYGGFARLTLSDRPGVWMRTFANHRLGLPNLAYWARDHGEHPAILRLFSGVLGYLKETGLPFVEGEAIRIDEKLVLTVRHPEPAEWWLDSPGPLWVLAETRDSE